MAGKKQNKVCTRCGKQGHCRTSSKQCTFYQPQVRSPSPSLPTRVSTTSTQRETGGDTSTQLETGGDKIPIWGSYGGRVVKRIPPDATMSSAKLLLGDDGHELVAFRSVQPDDPNTPLQTLYDPAKGEKLGYWKPRAAYESREEGPIKATTPQDPRSAVFEILKEMAVTPQARGPGPYPDPGRVTTTASTMRIEPDGGGFRVGLVVGGVYQHQGVSFNFFHGVMSELQGKEITVDEFAERIRNEAKEQVMAQIKPTELAAVVKEAVEALGLVDPEKAKELSAELQEASIFRLMSQTQDLQQKVEMLPQAVNVAVNDAMGNFLREFKKVLVPPSLPMTGPPAFPQPCEHPPSPFPAHRPLSHSR